MRMKKAMTNTHGKVMRGIVMSRGKFYPTPVFVRFTSDTEGETISFQAGDTMIAVPFEGVKKLIIETRADKRGVQ